MPAIEIRDTVLHYEEAGTGDPLLLVHGGLGTALLHWWREMPVFAGRYRVIAPDLRGYGRSSPPRDFPLDFYHRDAADLAEVLRALNCSPAHVVGWSDGAVAALVLAARYPEAVRRLVCIAGEARFLEEERPAWPALVDTSTWSERAVARFIEAQGPLNWPGVLARMVAGYNAILDQRGGEIISRELGAIRCPTFLIHGDADPVIPVAHAHELHRQIEGSSLRIFPGSGHTPHREHAEEVQRMVLHFLAGDGG